VAFVKPLLCWFRSEGVYKLYKNTMRVCLPFFVKLIRRFLSFCLKRRINFTKRVKDPANLEHKFTIFVALSKH
jgi:hypothetical protein